MQDAHEIIGRLKGLKEGKLEILHPGYSTIELVTPGFDNSPAFISDRIGSDVSVVIIDDKAVQVKRNGPDRNHEIRYPKDL